MIAAVFGFINFTSAEFRSVESKQNYKNIFAMLVGFIVVYVLMNLISVHYMLRSFENTFLLSGLFIVHDILFIYGLVLAVQKYKVAFIFLAIGQLLPALIIIYLFFTASGDLSYYSFQLISIIINISCVVIFLRGYLSNKLEFS